MAKKEFTRRDFVLKSAVGLGGLAVARYVPQGSNASVKAGNIHTAEKTKRHCPEYVPSADQGDIVFENDEVRLVIGKDGTSKSLVFKPANEECLIKGKSLPVSTITQDRPYQNEVKLAYPCEETTFRSNAVHREGDRLIIGYELIHYKVAVKVEIKPHYIRFTLDDFIVKDSYSRIDMVQAPVLEMWFFQLPLQARTYFGDWLKVVWDDKVAITMLATDPRARIESEEYDGNYILKAGAVRDIGLKGVNAALVTCAADKLLDNIAQAEEDYDLPHGVKSRRSQEYKLSYYWTHDLNPHNFDRHLKYARMGGFRAMLVYYTAFMDSNGYRNLGNYNWRRSEYPNGKADLQKVLNRLDKEGIIAGFHFLHSHIGLDSKYVTPRPDHRLNLRKIFTLASPLGRDDTTIHVDQNPSYAEMADRRRILRIGSELISYTGYTTVKPYQFTGCVRGVLHTTPAEQPAGYMLGILDVSEFGAQSVYVNQDNDLQDEIAEKLADIYGAGFKFCYFDGSEGVNPPFWYNVSGAQWRVHKRLQPEPLFAEGAAKTHFSWHMLSRGNAFDTFRPEELKEAIKKHPAAEAPRMQENFTHINFGWLGYWVPNDDTVGTQPDMLEYASSRAAAWDCPLSIQANTKGFDGHPRTPDNLEVLKRWEDVRVQGWLTPEQKEQLKNLDQEHILLLNEKNEFELQPYDQIMHAANGSREVRAFLFNRNNDPYVVYWHISGNKKLLLSLPAKEISLMEDFHKGSRVAYSRQKGKIIIPVSNRRFIKIKGMEKNEIIQAFQNAEIVT